MKNHSGQKDAEAINEIRRVNVLLTLDDTNQNSDKPLHWRVFNRDRHTRDDAQVYTLRHSSTLPSQSILETSFLFSSKDSPHFTLTSLSLAHKSYSFPSSPITLLIWVDLLIRWWWPKRLKIPIVIGIKHLISLHSISTASSLLTC